MELFRKLPGIGPRHALRCAFFALREEGFIPQLTTALTQVASSVTFCAQCFRSMDTQENRISLCTICRDQKRNHTLIAVVEKEADMQSLEVTKLFTGTYHVLHGILDPLDASSPKRLHLRELYTRIMRILEEKKLRDIEVLLATNSTAEGDTTARYIEQILKPLGEKYPLLRISRLGRGLSLGAELEYVDDITLQNALTNRR